MIELSQSVREVYPWQGKRIDVDGGKMHVVDEGPRDAEVLLCLHGNPTWSFYWRDIVHTFSDRYRVVVPDHIGCGLSDKPQDWGYRLEQHVVNIERVVEELDLNRVTLLVHDWGGAIGMGVATRHVNRLQRLVVTNTAAFRSLRIPPSIATVKIPVFGTLAVRGLNAFCRAAVVRATHRGLSPVAKEGLLAPYSDWKSRIATLRFVQDIPLRPDHPSYDTLAEIEDRLPSLSHLPMLLMWGNDDFCFTPHFRDEWVKRFPHAEVHHWDDVGHYVMEDAPQKVLGLVDGFLQSHPLEEVA